MTPRLKADIWVKALIRRCYAADVPAMLVRRGEEGSGAVFVCTLPAPGQVILIRQYRYVLDRCIWELPAGSLKPGEAPDAAAARECEEEIGLVPGRLERLHALHPTPGYCDEVMIFYRCTELGPPRKGSTATQDEDEDIEPRVFTVEEARALVSAGEIVDLKTVAGLFVI